MAEIIDRVGPQRLLKPADFVILQHLGSAHRPFEAVRPMSIARAGIDEKLRAGTGRIARGAHDRFVELGIAGAPERSPADLEGAKAAAAIFGDALAHPRRFFHQERAIGQDALAVDAAEQAPDWLPRHLAENVPERDVDAA